MSTRTSDPIEQSQRLPIPAAPALVEQSSGTMRDETGDCNALPMTRVLRVLVVLEALGVVAIVVAAALTLFQLHEKALDSAAREVDNLSRLLAEQTTRAIQSVDLILLATQERLREADEQGTLASGRVIHNLFRARVDALPQVRALNVVDAQGNLEHSSTRYPPPPLSVGDREFFRAHVHNPRLGLHIDRPVFIVSDGAWIVYMSRRLERNTGYLRGVVFASLDRGYFQDLYRSIDLGKNSYIGLFLRDGTELVSWPAQHENVSWPRVTASASHPVESGRQDIAPRPVAAGNDNPRLVAFRTLGDYPLTVVVRLDEDSVLARWRREAMLIGSGAGLVLFTLFLSTAALRREMRRAQEFGGALRDSQAHTRSIVESAMDAIISVEDDQRIVLFNPAAEKMFGLSAAEAMGRPLDQFIPRRYWDGYGRYTTASGGAAPSAGLMAGALDINALRADGREFPIDASVSQGVVGGRQTFTIIVRDVTRRREAEGELRASHARLQELSASLQSVRESERARIARELHDELGQQLTGLKMELMWLEGRLRDAQPALREKIKETKAMVDFAVSTVRRIASELRPLMLDDLGLVPALEWLAGDFSRRSGIDTELDLEPGDDVLDEAHSIALFRIAQEALTNVGRHAHATTVRIQLRRRNDGLVLTVRDNGSGMPTGAEVKEKSLGLMGIRERVRLLGGEVRIESAPGEGTAIEVCLPVPRTEPRAAEQER